MVWHSAVRSLDGAKRNPATNRSGAPGLRFASAGLRTSRCDNRKGRIFDPAFRVSMVTSAQAACASPSFFSASCTFGRAVTRAL
ncbi:hypothetical protein ABIB73_004465 [Bradyrhizobium sp. F1.4.3]